MQRGHDDHQPSAQKVTDAVCGMSIDPTRAAGSSMYNGAECFFCSPGCKQKFDAGPARAMAEAGIPRDRIDKIVDEMGCHVGGGHQGGGHHGGHH